jgi:hypothetical protein
MTSKIIIALSLLFINSLDAAHTNKTENILSFKISFHHFNLGYLKAIQLVSDNTNTFSIHGKAEGDLFFKKIVSENNIYSVFEKGELISSNALFIRNGKTLSNTRTTLQKGAYVVSTIEKKNQLVNHSIYFTVGRMYFQEPKDVEFIYSEAWGKDLQLSRKNNTYSFTIPDGTVCIFKYQNGILQEMISKTMIGDIKFTKI